MQPTTVCCKGAGLLNSDRAKSLHCSGIFQKYINLNHETMSETMDHFLDMWPHIEWE